MSLIVNNKRKKAVFFLLIVLSFIVAFGGNFVINSYVVPNWHVTDASMIVKIKNISSEVIENLTINVEIAIPSGDFFNLSKIDEFCSDKNNISYNVDISESKLSLIKIRYLSPGKSIFISVCNITPLRDLMYYTSFSPGLAPSEKYDVLNLSLIHI